MVTPSFVEDGRSSCADILLAPSRGANSACLPGFIYLIQTHEPRPQSAQTPQQPTEVFARSGPVTWPATMLLRSWAP